MGRFSERSMRTFPIDEMTNPRGKGMVQIYEDRWWAVSENDELYFYGTERSPYLSPQCNLNPVIARSIAQKGLLGELGTVKEFSLIPIVFVPVNISDYID